MAITFDSSDVAGLSCGTALQNLKNRLGRTPLMKEPFTAPIVGDQPEDLKIREGLSGRACDPFQYTETAFAIDESALLFSPGGGGQNKMSQLRCFSRGVH